ncbi:acyl-CoA thioesterase [Kribbia dieselivorans]|uniref:acyl-CoA thioesterase n=1 Tax=Kribbia dieselivorans TaxID=331526 RepID=UPI000838CC12|nr:acyl-CoA thioesterase domain-containing protein [Kribbia dieselivorans]
MNRAELWQELTQQILEAGPQALADMLDLERIEQNLFRANYVFDEPHSLFGGQVLAQALVAAGRTVDEDRPAHSLHAYFLRAGDPKRPLVLEVFRDRDGRSFSARRVVAVQNGEVILNLSCSFALEQEGLDVQPIAAPDVPGPGHTERMPRLFSFEVAQTSESAPRTRIPERIWGRCLADLGDDTLLHAAALTYFSDISAGIVRFETDVDRLGPSLDHALWFHAPARADDWLLLDLAPNRVLGGRGLYSGGLYTPAGELVVSVAQEQLFRRQR